MSNSRPASWIFLSLFVSLCPAFGQNVAGTILGTLTDVSGAAVTSASIVAINEETGIEYRAAVGDSGEYTAANLPSGTYTVKTQLAGFRPTIVKGISLLANRWKNR